MKIEALKSRLEELGVRSKKSLGQNFLISDFVIDDIVEEVKRVEPAFLIEIGPGLGALTEALLVFKPLLIELDGKLAEFWRKRGCSVIENDALKVKWDQLALPPNSWIVSNLPYQISTHLVVDRSFGPLNISGMVLMFQKEVAQRLTALPRSSAYGLLSVIAQNFWKMNKLIDAAPRDFYPSPRVASRVLVFKRKATDLDVKFLSFVKVAFEQRRKLLIKNLKAINSKFQWERLLETMQIGPKARAEELSAEQFAELYRRWKNL